MESREDDIPTFAVILRDPIFILLMFYNVLSGFFAVVERLQPAN